jgi:hypothetical protein
MITEIDIASTNLLRLFSLPFPWLLLSSYSGKSAIPHISPANSRRARA